MTYLESLHIKQSNEESNYEGNSHKDRISNTTGFSIWNISFFKDLIIKYRIQQKQKELQRLSRERQAYFNYDDSDLDEPEY